MPPDTVSSNERRLRRRVDDLWSRLQKTWLQIPLRQSAELALPTWEVFSEHFDRCFRRVSLYVGRHVSDRTSLEQIVRRVLSQNIGLFIEPCDAQEEMTRLKASADRMLALRPLIDPGARAPASGATTKRYLREDASSAGAWLNQRHRETTLR